MAAGRGAVSTIVDVSLPILVRARFFVLGLFVLVAIVSLYEAILESPARSLIYLAIACAAYSALAAVHLRHWALGVLVAAAPLPGVLTGYALAASRSADTFMLLALGYALAFVIALFLADDISAQVASPAQDAAPRLLRTDGGAISATALLAAVSLVPGFLIRHFAIGFAPAIAVGILGALFSASLILPLGASILKLDEDFVVRTNRASEWRARMLGHLAPATRPRFGWSASGIALVFFVLALFGARSLHVAASARIVAFAGLPLLALLMIGAAFGVLRDWRRAVAVGFALLPAAMMGCWAAARSKLLLGVVVLTGLALTIAVGFALVLFVAIHAGSSVSTEDDVAAGSQRALESRGATACAATLAVLLGSAPFFWSRLSEGKALAVVVLFAALASVVFQPAFAIAIETRFPRRSTIDRRYRVQ